MLGSLDVTVTAVMKQLIIGFEKSAVIDEASEAAYGAAFPTRDTRIGAIAFPLDVITAKFVYREPPLDELRAALREKPAMLAVGVHDPETP